MAFDLDQRAAFAVFAPPTFNVAAEAPGVISANARRGQLTEQLANWGKGACVSDRVRARCSANCALIDHDRLVELVESAESAIISRFVLRIMKMPEEGASQNMIHQS